ncbi:ABC transporter ATP-binding protein [Tuanshanicoccus lijuaniae]|uniref:ABC transporter ATP-binding protein n=1 Tax=Aerococcaceae bacterium zg-1292 TaxID=2774330 RepID=UPI001936F87A|nr:ABC transporter ATP-binding protein [Aerococcaceae bacterium zg-1292]QQA36307.1 ABC transporter ATP-binding protein [Aerococcaceae bacterium zg-1292]
MDALKIENLHKSYGNHVVLDGLSFRIPENTIFGFLGKNGAGKTTTMKTILGFLRRDKGTIEVFGEQVQYGQTNTNRFIGYLPDVPEFYGYMTPKEYLQLCGAITGLSNSEIIQKSDELLELVGLNKVEKRIQGFSRGMKQRLGIAQALMNSPKLLICDEPTSALDPIGRKEILDILRKIKSTTTVVFSTHILSDVESICDYVVVLDGGKNVLEGSIDELKKMKQMNEIIIKFKTFKELNQFKHNPMITTMSFEEEGDTLIFSGESTEENALILLHELYAENIVPLEYSVNEPTLENIFMEVIQS